MVSGLSKLAVLEVSIMDVLQYYSSSCYRVTLTRVFDMGVLRFSGSFEAAKPTSFPAPRLSPPASNNFQAFHNYGKS